MGLTYYVDTLGIVVLDLGYLIETVVLKEAVTLSIVPLGLFMAALVYLVYVPFHPVEQVVGGLCAKIAVHRSRSVYIPLGRIALTLVGLGSRFLSLLVVVDVPV